MSPGPVHFHGSLSNGAAVDATVSITSHSGLYWRQCGRLNNPWVPEENAFDHGRYHARGKLPVWYGSSCEVGSWAELERHSSIDPMNILRYLTLVQVTEVQILDLTDAKVRNDFGSCTWDQLSSGPPYELCQSIAALAFQNESVEGIRAPSAALKGHAILALRRQVLYDGTGRVLERDRRVGTPPELFERLRDQVPKIIK
jgi:hypothetical protein